MKNNFRFKQIIKLQSLLVKSGKGSKPSSNLLITWLKVYAIVDPWEFAYRIPASAEQLF
jgi:hypothetical protein